MEAKLVQEYLRFAKAAILVYWGSEQCASEIVAAWRPWIEEQKLRTPDDVECPEWNAKPYLSWLGQEAHRKLLEEKAAYLPPPEQIVDALIRENFMPARKEQQQQQQQQSQKPQEEDCTLEEVESALAGPDFSDILPKEPSVFAGNNLPRKSERLASSKNAKRQKRC